jgi:O-antigen/teichoic acid export membrane protein
VSVKTSAIFPLSNAAPGRPEPRVCAPNSPATGQPESDAHHRVLRNSVLNLLGQGCCAGVQIAFIAILARGLDRENFGTFYAVFTLIVVVQILLEMGLSTVLTRRLAHAPEGREAILEEAAGLGLASSAASLLGFLGVGVGVAWIQGDAEAVPTWAAAGVACAAIQVQRFSAGVLHASEWFVSDNLARLLQGILFTVLLIVLVTTTGARAWSAVAMLALSNVVSAVFLLTIVRRKFGCRRVRLTRARARDWLKESLPLWLGDMLRGVTRQLGTLLLWGMASVEAVGVYSIAYRPLGPLELLPRVILQASFPSFARMAGSQLETLSRSFSTCVRILWIVSLPIAVAIGIAADPLVSALAGPAYRDAVLPMQISSWIVPCLFVSVQFRFLFAALGQSRLYIRLVVAALVLQGALVAAMIPAWGYTGACVGALLGEAVFMAAGLAACRRLGVRAVEGPALVSAVVAAGIMAGGLWWFRDLPLLLLAPALVPATAGYFGLCVAFGAIRPAEVRRFGAALAVRFRTGEKERSPVSSGGHHAPTCP